MCPRLAHQALAVQGRAHLHGDVLQSQREGPQQVGPHRRQIGVEGVFQHGADDGVQRLHVAQQAIEQYVEGRRQGDDDDEQQTADQSAASASATATAHADHVEDVEMGDVKVLAEPSRRQQTDNFIDDDELQASLAKSRRLKATITLKLVRLSWISALIPPSDCRLLRFARLTCGR